MAPDASPAEIGASREAIDITLGATGGAGRGNRRRALPLSCRTRAPTVAPDAETDVTCAPHDGHLVASHEHRPAMVRRPDRDR
ncbi:MAG: hypothetical protein NVS9B3_02330 [Gemmatimonadaceae bacterium]